MSGVLRVRVMVRHVLPFYEAGCALQECLIALREVTEEASVQWNWLCDDLAAFKEYALGQSYLEPLF
jgi:hypothetical protein